MEKGDKQKVLITLSPETCEDSQKVDELVGKVMKAVEPGEVDQKKLRRYGILSSVADTDVVETLKGFDGVEGVEVVGEKRAY
ncbi:MAG: hypothetical protein H7145_15875 [Akkermansiaceae bacterium]|nr:hypothetical protein [Armatimonadota bacterium]